MFRFLAFVCLISLMQTSLLKAELSWGFSTQKLHDALFKKNDPENDNLSDVKLKNQASIATKTDDKAEKYGEDDVEIRVKIGGLLDSSYSHIDQKSEYMHNLLPNGYTFSPQFQPQNGLFANDNVLSLRSRFDFNSEFLHKPSGIKAGVWIITPALSQNINKDSDPKTASQEYVYINTQYARFEFGSTYSSASKMRIDPSRLASGTGGVYGDWWRYVTFPVFDTTGLSLADAGVLNTFSPSFLIYPTLPNEAGFTVQRSLFGNIGAQNFVGQNMIYGGSAMQALPTQGARSNKISLYTTRVHGVQFGYSYSPTTEDSGYIFGNAYSSGMPNLIGGYVRDYMSFGLNYKEQFDDIGVGLSITHEIGNMGSINYFSSGAVRDISNSSYLQKNNLNATAYGLQLSYKNFAISYSYGDWRDSLLTKSVLLLNGQYQLNNEAGSSSYHVLGAGYNFGPINLGFTYMNSNLAGNQLQVWSLGTDFKMMSLRYFRVQPYLEFTYFMFTPRSYYLVTGSSATYQPVANKGYVVLTGVRVTF